MRKLISYYLSSSALVFFVLIIACFSGVGIILSISAAIGLVYLLFSFFLSFNMSCFGLDRRWFDTQEELDKKLTEARQSWETADKLIRIIGEHEAVKMWEENIKESEK